MRPGGEQYQDHQPDNHQPGTPAGMGRRYGRKPGLDGGRVVLGPHAFLKGWIVTFGVWGLSTLVFSTLSEIIGPNSGAVTFWGIAMVVSLLVAIVIAAPLALILSVLLRRVLNQWVHVAAFAVVFAGLAAATTVLVLPGTGSTFPAILAVVVGISAGVGRAAIIRNVNP
ncbi:hypothetical protein IWX64_000054 [Arthrobacter sp. CAN_A212]|uniref:hypothetical protein n=1 Tax=unclassified Arthrobacter TaxID=235627 RepID=UPI0018CBCF08|nr:hypothetical protein [Arthrobacter sp. CAN_C5]MBP2215768.1 putative membrane protein [Arthrobacter sp. CAN_C5]